MVVGRGGGGGGEVVGRDEVLRNNLSHFGSFTGPPEGEVNIFCKLSIKSYAYHDL